MNKVLVVDDSDGWFTAVATELGKAGCEVLRARHEDEALASALDEQPDLVLIDVLLAARAGAGFVRRMRSLPSMQNTPMLLTSSGTQPAAVSQALGGTFGEIISKTPRELGRLSDRLRARSGERPA